MTVRKGWVLSVALAVNLILPTLCHTSITETCSVCHTMHNSEQGTAVAYTLDSSGQRVISDQPFDQLLKTDCLGCHSQAGAETINSLGGINVYATQTLGFTESRTALLFGIMGFTNALVKIPAGYIGDRFDVKKVLLVTFSALILVYIFGSLFSDMVSPFC